MLLSPVNPSMFRDSFCLTEKLDSEYFDARPDGHETGALCTLLCSWYRDNPRPPFKLHTPERKYIASRVLRRLDVWYDYEELVIHESTALGGKLTAVSLEEIVQPRNGVKFIIIAGEFGFGKTAMGWELYQRWGKKAPGYEHFKAVIFCDLRNSEIQRAKTLNELLSSGAYDPSVQKSVSAEVDACDMDPRLCLYLMGLVCQLLVQINQDDVFSLDVCVGSTCRVLLSSLLVILPVLNT